MDEEQLPLVASYLVRVIVRGSGVAPTNDVIEAEVERAVSEITPGEGELAVRASAERIDK